MLFECIHGTINFRPNAAFDERLDTLPLQDLCLCNDNAYTDRLTPVPAFNGAL